MEDWTKTKNPINWNAPTKKAGRSEYTVWEAMLELEPHEQTRVKRTKELELVSVLHIPSTLVTKCCADNFRIREEWFLKAVRRRQCKSTQQYCQVASSLWVLLRLVMQIAMRAVFKVLPELRIKVFVVNKKVTYKQKSRRSSQDSFSRVEEAQEYEKSNIIITRRRKRVKE